MNKRIPQLCKDSECTGCSACNNICPVKAIEMRSNHEGFFRPVINSDTCIGCLKCERTCPILNPIPQKESEIKVYAGWHIDGTIRINSSSGGAFSALAETAIIDLGGVVYGAAYDNSMNISHIRIDNIAGLSALRMSKYAQSNIGNIFRQIKKDLADNRFVLFCGTPCQAAGLRKFVSGCEHDNLIIVDFICHGVPSQLMLSKYSQWLSARLKDKVTAISFRDKRKGWYDNVRIASLENGDQKVLKGRLDNYWIAFNRNSILQESCYSCQFIGKSRNSDITLSDYWNIGRIEPFGHIDEIEKGVSAILISTNAGASLLNRSKKRLELYERSLDEVISGNQTLIRPAHRPTNRDTLYSDLLKENYENFIKRHLKPTIKENLVKLFREYLPYTIIKKIRLRNQL